jgi:hypothetical protein
MGIPVFNSCYSIAEHSYDSAYLLKTGCKFNKILKIEIPWFHNPTTGYISKKNEMSMSETF